MGCGSVCIQEANRGFELMINGKGTSLDCGFGGERNVECEAEGPPEGIEVPAHSTLSIMDTTGPELAPQAADALIGLRLTQH
jgi:hypothetical protein